MLNLFRKDKSGGTVPPGWRVYAIGDIHGRSDLLGRLSALIRRDAVDWQGKTAFVFIGDYVDRGPDSRGVIDMLLQKFRRADTKFLRGNHDQALLDFLTAPATYARWRTFGGAETLRSYGVTPPDAEIPHAMFIARSQFTNVLPLAHRQFLQNTRMSFELGDYFFAHAGVRPGVALARQSPQDLMWIREEFLDSKEDFGKIVVHGHSPSHRPVRRTNRIGIDTEAYATGRLTAVVLEAAECRFLHT